MPSPADRETQGESDVHVQFTIKELLARIDGKIDIITALVHEKADKADLSRVEFRVGTMEKVAAERKEVELVEARVVSLERETASALAVEQNKADIEKFNTKLRWTIIGTGVSIVGLLTGLIQFIIRHP